MLGRWMMLAIGGAAAWAGSALGEERKIDLKKVPAPARAAASQAAPGVKWDEALLVTEDGKTTYELSGDDARGDGVEVEVTPEGQVLTVELEVPMSQVPKVVIDALKAKARGFKGTTAEEVRRGGKLVGYEFEGKKGGEQVEVNVSLDGKTVEIDD